MVARFLPLSTKPYVKRGKNDANDAAAICEAMSRPTCGFVPIKSADQQAVLMLHKTLGIAGQAANHDRQCAARSSLGVRLDLAQGHPPGQGIAGARASRQPFPKRPRSSRDAGFATAIASTKRSTIWKTIAQASGKNQTSRLLDGIPAFGPLIASAMVAFNPDPSVFRSGRRFQRVSRALPPRPAPSGGKDQLGAHHQKGQPISAQDAGRGMHVGAARGPQIQRRPGRMDRRHAGQGSPSASSPSPWPQAGQDHAWAMMSTGIGASLNRTLHEGLTTKRLSPRQTFQFRRDWQAQ